MGAIYSAAHLTLIACAGNGQTYGLPGVSIPRQFPELVEYIGPYTITNWIRSSYQNHHDILDSVWASRAWTYQEGYLSKRRLFFTDNEVVYICSETGINLDGSLPHLFGADTSGSLFAHAKSMIRQYTRRHLSFESDALDAIVGALNTLDAQTLPVRHVLGLPFCRPASASDSYSPANSWLPLYSSDATFSFNAISSSDATFALNWYHPHPAHHRHGFPTWSPVAWNGAMEFYQLLDQPLVPTDLSVKVVCDSRRYSIDALLKLDSKTFRKLTENVAPLLRISAKTLEVKLEYITWDTSSQESSHMSNGYHVILPGVMSHEVCILPFWDNDNLELAEHKSVLCAILMQEVDEQKLDWSVFLILMFQGSHYERIGSFLLEWKDEGLHKKMFRTKEGQWRKSNTDGVANYEPRMQWMLEAKKLRFRLG
jgi:hypothetical protein